jgi:hypothetical protein
MRIGVEQITNDGRGRDAIRESRADPVARKG